MSEATLSRVLTLAGGRFTRPVSELGPDDDLFESLGIDSVQALELLSDLERAFGVDLPDYELAEVRSFRDLAERIAARQ
ncbi:MAG: acyl carrier protein [Planctomycetes bacterium]|nr:acyl carrier protein [Planctomycetota bacterium]